MSRGRIITVVIATAIGVGNGFYVFQPYLREQKESQLEGTDKTNDIFQTDLAKQADTRVQIPSIAEAPATTSTENPARPASIWASIREFGTRTFEPGDLREKWAKDNEQQKRP